jgi:glucarate dehydratase
VSTASPGTAQRIARVVVTPVAVPDPPLLNAAGCHEPYALRAIVEVEDGRGRVGLGEGYGDEGTVQALRRAAERLPGLDPWHLPAIWAAVREAVGAPPEEVGAAGTVLHGAAHHAPGAARSPASNAYAAIEVACLDLQGQQAGVPVAELLGGRQRGEVEFAAYLFYKFARHAPRDPAQPETAPPPDEWGEALDPAGIVRQARRFAELYGFRTFKLKGGVFPPEEEVAAVAALRQALGPEARLRIDPNGIWTVETAVRAGERLREIGLEYYEDPTSGMEGMAEVRRRTGLPTATNMCVTSFGDLPRAVGLRPVDYILADHHFWGGLRATVHLSAFCRDFGIGVSMHSNTHLGVSLAAMVHVAAAMPHLTAACDTHYPWQAGHDVVAEPWRFRDGRLRVPETPGLGVTLDRRRLAEMHEDWQRCGIRRRNDRDEMRRHVPGWEYRNPRW